MSDHPRYSFKKTQDEEKTLTQYVLYDWEHERGWFRLDHICGEVSFVPKAWPHMLVSAEDGEPYRALAEHMLRFSGGVPAQESQRSKPVQAELVPGFKEWSKR